MTPGVGGQDYILSTDLSPSWLPGNVRAMSTGGTMPHSLRRAQAHEERHQRIPAHFSHTGLFTPSASHLWETHIPGLLPGSVLKMPAGVFVEMREFSVSTKPSFPV